ncbi:hypothetical protein [Streptomyces sp. NBC_01538]|uniref:hypothetical protein n=1 Tax=Streptomyces sp. NBC_01538 TaxID=2903897 RepID=UPI003867FF1B
MDNERAAVAPALAAGVCVLLVKDAGGTAVRDAIRSVVRTGTFRTGTLRAGRSAPSAAPVTAREYDVLRLVSAGYTNPEIGFLPDLSDPARRPAPSPPPPTPVRSAGAGNR